MESVEIMLPCRREHDFDDFAPSIFAHVWYFPPLVVFMFFWGCLSAGTRLSLEPIFILIWGCHGVPLGRSFASTLSLLCLLVPVRTSWSASARESFPNGHKTGSRFVQFGSLFVRFGVFVAAHWLSQHQNESNHVDIYEAH